MHCKNKQSLRGDFLEISKCLGKSEKLLKKKKNSTGKLKFYIDVKYNIFFRQESECEDAFLSVKAIFFRYPVKGASLKIFL